MYMYVTIYISAVYVYLSQQKYSAQLEPMLVTHVFPEFTNQLGYMRARVSALLQCACSVHSIDCVAYRFAGVLRIFEMCAFYRLRRAI